MIKAQQRTRIAAVVVTTALSVGVAACGGSSTSTSTKASGSTTSGSASAPGPAKSPAKFHAVLTGQDHAPVATKQWHYTVRVTSTSGQPLDGSVDTEFAFGGQVVGRESPPTHRLKNGTLVDVVEFPKQSVGQPIELQVVVHTSLGSQTLDWPVNVKP